MASKPPKFGDLRIDEISTVNFFLCLLFTEKIHFLMFSVKTGFKELKKVDYQILVVWIRPSLDGMNDL